MVTEIVETEGEDIPAPAITVLLKNPSNSDTKFYRNQVLACLNKSISSVCLENIGDKPEELFNDAKGKWIRYFNTLGGWQYFRKGLVSMKDVNKDKSNLAFHLRANKTEMQIYIHDKNEVLNFLNGIKVTELSKDSLTVSITIRKIRKVRNCEAHDDYSFSDCIENFITQVKGSIHYCHC